MEIRDVIIIVLIGIIIYYLSTLNKQTPSSPIQQKTPEKKEEGIDRDIKFIEPEPIQYVDPYIIPYYDPYVYPYWDPYDVYPYGIYGIDSGADWNSNYLSHKGHKREYRKRNRPENRKPNRTPDRKPDKNKNKN